MTTRRRVLAGLAVSPFAMQGFLHQAQGATSTGGEMLFVGTGTTTGSKGIYAYNFDPATGDLTQLALAAEAPTPSFLALSPNGKFLFAVNEIESYQGKKTGAVSSYALDKTAGKLTLINTVASGGSGPCHINTDLTGSVLFAANYTGGSASSFKISADGHISEAVSNFVYESKGAGPGQDQVNQRTAHAHHATTSPDNRFVYINDLGLDRIHIYRLDAATAKLTPNEPAQWTAEPGSGPRVLRFHPSGRWAYCVNELASTIDLLDWNAESGALTLVEKTHLLPRDFSGKTGAAEIVFDKKGKFAYVSNRLIDFLATFQIDPAGGKLSAMKQSTCGGKTPRHIALDPGERWLLVANQGSDIISAFARDPNTGAIATTGPTAAIQSPQCLLFV